MSARIRARSGALIALTSLGLLTTSLAWGASTATANPAGTGLVISEVYGAGGNASATYNADFVELYNPTDAPISLNGKSIHYRSNSGSSGGSPFVLSGEVPAGGNYLIRMSTTGTVGVDLPAPDAVATPGFNMASGGGQTYLLDGSTAVTANGEMAGAPNVIDMVGGNGATSFETAAVGAVANSTNSIARNATGVDTNNNSTDFAAGAPTPTPSGSEPEPPADPVDATIAEVQGNTEISPMNGTVVTTTGVITGRYATGGFNGFYLQTGGTGGGTDATPGRSDGIFIYGTEASSAAVEIGDSVEVTGSVTEFQGLTEITATEVTELTTALAPVTPLASAWPATATEREAHEGELFAPTGPFTVTNTYSTNQYGELGLAAQDSPLIQPTELFDAQGTDDDALTEQNANRAVTLDDGASTNFLSTANMGTPLPWITKERSIQVGSKVTFTGGVLLDYRNNSWKFQPTEPVTDQGADVATFTDTRTPAPTDVGGDVRLATFNVLNYFNTTGADYVAGGGSCTSYKDRAGNPVTVNTCQGNGPRGAWDDANLTRQRDKIVAAINKLGAGIVSLEEIENSVALGEADRDDALASLVDALNTAAGSDVWAYAPSPDPADLPVTAEQDVIRTAFIYKPAAVELVGGSRVLTDSPAFANAREPLAQAFKPAGGADDQAFAVIVNHFKSKGSGNPDPDGQGNANDERKLQATALDAFADQFATDRGTEAVFLTGDFNSYSMEDPMQILYDAGYEQVESDTAGEETYSFSGRSGSLDHVLGNTAAMEMVTGADIWNINSGEPVAYEFSRYNYNATDFYSPDVYRASDHDPEVVGLDLPEVVAPTEVTLNILGVNDFHGRINDNTVKWAGTVSKLRADNPDQPTLMVGAGDLIGASEFNSSVANDQPTIDVMNSLGLDASAVGNHEFDKGWSDLRDRVIGADVARNAQWDYLGANVYAKGTTNPVLPEYASFEMGGLDVAVVGAVTEETSTLVSPAGIEEIDFGDPIEAVNRVAGELSDGDPANGEADVIIASFHAGATQGVGSNYEAEVAKGGEFGDMANLDGSVDAIFNGHTHQVYAWDVPKPGGGTRPIIQTGEYAANVGQIQLTVDLESGDVTAYTARNVARTTTSDADLIAAYPSLQEIADIVRDAKAEAAEVGNQPVGSITGDITRAYNGTTEDRGAESTLGDLVANALRDGLPEDITADIGIVNPGGLRADLTYAGNTANNPANTDGVVTYAEANAVLPFVNNIWTVKMTGAEVKSVLEEQWQPDGASRPYLQLGMSDNMRVTSDPSKPRGERITSIRINGELIDPAATYTVSTFSFLAAGGDNFASFKQGEGKDTGLVDRELWIDYLTSHQDLAPDFARQQVNESGMPSSVSAGDSVNFTLSKLDLTSKGSPANTSVTVSLVQGGETRDVGSFPVTAGSAAIAFTAPADLDGTWQVSVRANPSDTLVGPAAKTPSSLTATAEPMVYGEDGSVEVTVTPAEATGDVQLLDGDEVIATGSFAGGTATITIPGTALEVGTHTLTVKYAGTGEVNGSETTVEVEVSKAEPILLTSVSPTTVKVKSGTTTVTVGVGARGYTPTGVVGIYVDGELVSAQRLVDGFATLGAGPFKTVGSEELEIVYFGDSHTQQVRTTKTINVVKNKAKITVSQSPKTVKKGKKATLTIKVGATSITGTGSVKITGQGRNWNRDLSSGKASFTTKKFTKTGKFTFKVSYGGDADLTGGTKSYTVRVTK